ncbi:MAG TPA: rod shape-determining protein MreC [Conexibacter sp.]|nr:rod shape-determining protein MreC [Conexibacter sp.]
MYDKHVRRRRVALALLVVVSLTLLTLYFGESPGSPLHSVQRGVVTVLSPIQEGASRALKPVRDLFGWFGDTARAKEERDQLRAQRDRLLEQVVGYQVAMEENEELRGILRIDESNGLDAYEKRTVRIIGRSPNNLLRDTLQVNAGSGDGVRAGDAVIAGGGLVGHISTVAGGTAIVTLITDPSSIVSARVLNGAGNGEYGLVKPSVGDPLDLLVQLLPRDARIEEGDVVVTAGSRASRLESLYPPNVPIGRVTEADPQELDIDQQIHMAPIADLRHLDFVQVLLTSSEDAGARAQVGP